MQKQVWGEKMFSVLHIVMWNIHCLPHTQFSLTKSWSKCNIMVTIIIGRPFLLKKWTSLSVLKSKYLYCANLLFRMIPSTSIWAASSGNCRKHRAPEEQEWTLKISPGGNNPALLQHRFQKFFPFWSERKIAFHKKSLKTSSGAVAPASAEN